MINVTVYGLMLTMMGILIFEIVKFLWKSRKPKSEGVYAKAKEYYKLIQQKHEDFLAIQTYKNFRQIRGLLLK
jgi:hypothetical protein